MHALPEEGRGSELSEPTDNWAVRLARSPGGRKRLLIAGLAAYLTFEALCALAGVAIRPVHSAVASGFIGGMIGGILWWLFFTLLASWLQRRRSTPTRTEFGRQHRRKQASVSQADDL